MSLCDHLNSKPLLVCNVHVHCNLCGACEYHLGGKRTGVPCFTSISFLKNWATEKIQLRTRNVSNHMWSKCLSSTMKRYPYSTKLPKVDVMALQVICALLYLTLSQNSEQKSLVSTTEGAKKSVGDKRDFEILGISVAYMMMSFSLQHRTNNSLHSLWGCQAIVTKPSNNLYGGGGVWCFVSWNALYRYGITPGTLDLP
jgi:hypothetical protein